jgi:hypothetical protein
LNSSDQILPQREIKREDVPHAAKLNVGVALPLAKGMRRACGIIWRIWIRELANDLDGEAFPAE